MSIAMILMLLSLIIFVMDSFVTAVPRVKLQSLGLALLVLAMLMGAAGTVR